MEHLIDDIDELRACVFCGIMTWFLYTLWNLKDWSLYWRRLLSTSTWQVEGGKPSSGRAQWSKISESHKSLATVTGSHFICTILYRWQFRPVITWQYSYRIYILHPSTRIIKLITRIQIRMLEVHQMSRGEGCVYPISISCHNSWSHLSIRYWCCELLFAAPFFNKHFPAKHFDTYKNMDTENKIFYLLLWPLKHPAAASRWHKHPSLDFMSRDRLLPHSYKLFTLMLWALINSS